MAGRGGGGLGAYAAADQFLQFGEEEGPKAIIKSALEDALSTMEGLCANQGQLVTFENHVVDAFKDQTTEVTQGTDYEWDDIDIGDPYMEYMGEIIEEGNQIMSQACDEATEVEEIAEEEEALIYLVTGGKVGSFGDIIRDFFD